jgi:hypothetical protein
MKQVIFGAVKPLYKSFSPIIFSNLTGVAWTAIVHKDKTMLD